MFIEKSKNQLQNDPRKRFVSLAEEGKLSEMQLLANEIKDDQERAALLAYKDSDGYTALHRASYSNQLEVAKYLISLEKRSIRIFNMPISQLDAKTDMGWTPLHSASYWNAFTVVDYLINSAHSNVNSSSNSGQTPLHVAAQQSNNRETLILLLMHPFVDYSIKNHQNETSKEIAQRSCKHNALFEIAEDYLNRL